jgi:hypothetical protein
MKLPNNLFPEYDAPAEIKLLPQAGDMTHDAAIEYAKTTGYRLPTMDEIHYLIAVGKLKAGDSDCWSSSVISGYRGDAWFFYGDFGSVSFSNRSFTYGVRCVGRPCAVQTAPAASDASLSDVCILLTSILEKMKC